MNGAMDRDHYRNRIDSRALRRGGWDKRMCGQVAWALLAHTGLLIFFVTSRMETSGTSILPYFLLVIMVGIFIGVGRHYDHRWRILGPSELSYNSKMTRYRLDSVKLWLLAIGLPFLWAGLITFLRSVG